MDSGGVEGSEEGGGTLDGGMKSSEGGKGLIGERSLDSR